MNQKLFTALILLSALLAIGADFFNFQVLFFVFKPLTTILIGSLTFLFSAHIYNNYRGRIQWGLFFCLIGDVLLLFPSFFVFGLSAFLIAHLFFIAAFKSQQGWQWSPKTGLILVLFAALVLVLTAPQLGTLFVPVILYMTVIVLMSWQGNALRLSADKPSFNAIGWAVSLFLISDALIALDKFYQSFAGSGILILSTYWVAIFLLAHSCTKKEAV